MTEKYTSTLRDARVLALGGTSGIGYAVAEHALALGAHVFVSSSRETSVSRTITRLQAFDPQATSRVHGSVCDLQDISRLRSNLETLLKIVTHDGQLDHIVFTAGDALPISPINETSPEELQKLGNVRFYAPMILSGLVPQYMKISHHSSLTLTTGTAINRPLKGYTPLIAYGAGVEGLMRGLAVDLAPIRVNVVSPGAVRTERFDSFGEERLQATLDMFQKWSLTNTVATPEEASEAYVFLMKSRFSTGTVVTIDGGRLIKQ
ncbi:hypothetical protein CBER1_03569 [Cercospora berteroae]|uniref:Uncharacterized protein n=1 Tax=Cercospora berteroae TaxID=357750 RepID=A0A2S6C8G6_9PEZI|nr:hypothetical protein CBER1_03569 [Cercospora berteroae]